MPQSSVRLPHAPVLTRALGVALAVLAIALQFAPAAAAATEAAPTFSIVPAQDAAVDPNGGWFSLALQPGEERVQTLVVRNDGADSIDLLLAAVDATSANTGGIQYGDVQDAPVAAGAWIRPSREEIRLGVSESAEVSFTVTVPEDAGAGQHVAGLAAWVAEPTEASGEGVPEGFGAQVSVTTRRVVAVQVDVPGPAHTALLVEDVRAVAQPTGVFLEIDLRNAGNQLTDATGTVLVDGVALGEPFTIGTLVPGSLAQYRVLWSEQAPSGRHAVEVDVEFDGGREQWSGDVEVAATVVEELRDRSVIPGAVPSGSQGAAPSGIPAWAVSAGLLALAGTVAGAVLFATRGRHRTPAQPSAPRAWTDDRIAA